MSHKYFFTSDGKLRSVSDDELYHWKYIKREKVNGKWRYYYHEDDKKLKDKIKSGVDKLQDYAVVQNIRDKLGYDEKAYAEYAKNFADAGKTTNYVINGTKHTVDWGQEYIEAQKKFLKTPLGKIHQAASTIDKAKSWVSNLFSKKTSKKSKKKKK